jgi:hypothetical protein
VKPTKVFVHWHWRNGDKACKLVLGRQRAANYIRQLRAAGVRIIWTVCCH